MDKIDKIDLNVVYKETYVLEKKIPELKGYLAPVLGFGWGGVDVNIDDIKSSLKQLKKRINKINIVCNVEINVKNIKWIDPNSLISNYVIIKISTSKKEYIYAIHAFDYYHKYVKE